MDEEYEFVTCIELITNKLVVGIVESPIVSYEDSVAWCASGSPVRVEHAVYLIVESFTPLSYALSVGDLPLLDQHELIINPNHIVRLWRAPDRIKMHYLEFLHLQHKEAST